MDKRTGSLTRLLWQKYGDGYVNLTQVRAATGWADLNTADMMIMGSWPSTGNLLEGFEIKVSRSDWLNEVRNPHKNTSVKKYCNRWWLVIADETMVKQGELPEDWGMMALRNGKLATIKRAPDLLPETMDNRFVASLLRHNDKEQIPIDVHKDTLRDAVREAEANAKKKYEELRDFVRFLGKGLGITVQQGYSEEWGAALGKWGRHYSKEEAVGLFKSALAQDPETIKYQLEQARNDAKKIIEIVNDRLTQPTTPQTESSK